MKKNGVIKLNGLDFLLMAQNGSLKVNIDDKGNITGVDLSDDLIESYDGMLVAIHEHTKLLMDSNYTVIVRPITHVTPQLPNNQEQDLEIISDDSKIMED